MLRKLIKHDIISTRNEFLGIYLAYLLLALVSPFVLLNSPDWIASLIVLVIIGALITMVVITALAIIRLFQKRLFSYEGYLTWTLPVSVKTNLLSKVIVALLWYITTFIVIWVGVLLFASISLLLSGEFQSTMAVINQLMIQTGLIGKLLQAMVVLVPQTLVANIYSIMVLLFVITLVHTAWIKKGRLAIGIVLYFVISLMFGTLSSALITGLPITTNIGPGGFMINPMDPINSLLPYLRDFEFTYNIPLLVGKIGLDLLYIVLMSIGILYFVEKKLEIE